MLSTRNHDENRIYDQQTAAAAKPLNQGVKGLAPKTPGHQAPKTPFRKQLHDENVVLRTGKAKGLGQGGREGPADVKANKDDGNIFMTPAEPRTRAPLGNKTTNAKALGRPDAAPRSLKPASPRLRRPKIQIHSGDPLSTTATQDDHDIVADIEYMPPRSVPLSDDPTEWDSQRSYPQFEGANRTRGWWAVTDPRFAAYDNDEEAEAHEEELAKAEEEQFQAKLKRIEERREEQAASLRAKQAASALASMGGKSTVSGGGPRFAAPTVAAKARLPSSQPTSGQQLVASKARAGVKDAPSSQQGNVRHPVAKAVSNTTLGYAKGRAVSAQARPRVGSGDGIFAAPAGAGPKRNVFPFGVGNSLADMLSAADRLDEEESGQNEAEEMGRMAERVWEAELEEPLVELKISD